MLKSVERVDEVCQTVARGFGFAPSWFDISLSLVSRQVSRKLEIMEFVPGKVKLSILEQLVISWENATFTCVDVGRVQVASC